MIRRPSTHTAHFLCSRPLFSSLLVIVTIIVIMSAQEPDAAKQSPKKTIFFIRHAESEENRRIASLSRCFRTLGKFSLPSAADIRASTELLNVAAQVDSNVSDIGAKQIAEMGQTLKEANFVQTSGVQLVVHSPLTRARETSEGMLGCVAPDKKDSSVDRVVELELMKEKTPSEWTPVYWNRFKARMAEFEKWLAEQPEDRIALVGHSQYFKAMLGLDFKFGNCDVWQATFDASKMAATPEVLPVPAAEATVASETTVVDKDSTCDSTQNSAWNMPPQWSELKVLFQAKTEGED
jgi:broad specificity phosphatase PhoE